MSNTSTSTWENLALFDQDFNLKQNTTSFQFSYIYAEDIELLDNSSLLISGRFSNASTGNVQYLNGVKNEGYSDAFLLKFGSDGNLSNFLTFGSVNSEKGLSIEYDPQTKDIAYAICYDGSLGNIKTIGRDDCLVLRMDENFNLKSKHLLRSSNLDSITDIKIIENKLFVLGTTFGNINNNYKKPYVNTSFLSIIDWN